MLRFRQGGGADAQFRTGAESRGEDAMNAFRINVTDLGMSPLMNEFVPDCDAEGSGGHGGYERKNSEGRSHGANPKPGARNSE